jgi:probable O-glycosylation ligase (exosortase A-associated)
MIYYGILLFFILDYVRPTSYVPALMVLHLNSLVPLMVAVGSFSDSGPVKNADLLAEQTTKLFIFFLGLIAFAMVWVDVTSYAYAMLIAVLGYVLIFWSIAKQTTNLERIKGIFKTLIFVHVLVAALNPQMLTEPEVRHYVASGAFLGDGNDFALSVNVVIPMALFLFFDAKKKLHRVFWGSALALMVLCVVATQSRGGTIALAAVGFYYWLKSKRKGAMAAVAAVAVVLVLIFAPSAYFDRMNTISTQEGSAQGRIQAWGAAVEMMASNPLLGVGAGHFAVKYGAEFSHASGTPWHTAHSIYFLILGEYGLPGIILLLTLIIGNLVANKRVAEELRRTDPSEDTTQTRLLASLSASMLAFATAGAFLSAIYYPHMYVLGGLLIAGRRIARELQPSATPAVRQAAPAVTYHWAIQRARNAPARRPFAQPARLGANAKNRPS